MITVVVTTYNRRELLSRCLQSLAGQNCSPSAYEVIVVIDGSTDGTQEFLRTLRTDHALRVMDQPNRGLAAARNVGLRAAAGEIVMFLDDDLICSPQVLSEHIAAHRSEPRVIAFGPVLVAPAPSDNAATRMTRKFYAEEIYGPLDRGEPPTWPVHARVPPNCSISTELLLSYGGFDEDFVNAHEDIELGIRLWRSGVSFRYLPNASVEHVYTKSDRELATAEAARGGKCEVRLCRKHLEYRHLSQLAGAINTRLYRDGFGDFVLRSNLASGIAGGLIAAARHFGANGDRLPGLQTNFNLLRAAIREAGSWQRFRSEFFMRLPVLLYHHVGEPRFGELADLTIGPHEFELQMQWLEKNGYTAIGASDWLGWCESAASLPEKPVLITFDDAYEDLVRYAFPVLQRHQFRAMVFVPTAYVGQSNLWDQARGCPSIDLMDAASIRYWAGNGIDFGAHSRTHPELDHIEPAALEEEIAGSLQDLERLLGAPVIAFAYPYGNHNAAVREGTGRHFRLAFTTEDGMNTLATDLLTLHRTMVKPGQSMLDFASRVRFGRSIPEDAKAGARQILGAR